MSYLTKVVAFETTSAAYDSLTLIVEQNHLKGVISAHRAAVAAEVGQEVMIPRQASPYNATRQHKKNGERVRTTSLKDIVRDIGPIDLLKLDCEGAEYEILLQADEDALSGIAAIRMEYHAGGSRNLPNTLPVMVWCRVIIFPTAPFPELPGLNGKASYLGHCTRGIALPMDRARGACMECESVNSMCPGSLARVFCMEDE